MARKKHKHNTGNIGAEGELRVTVDLMGKGYEVYRAMSPSASVDLIVLKDSKALRVEVTKGNRKGNPEVLKWAPHNALRFDVLAVWEADGKITYMGSLLATESI